MVLHSKKAGATLLLAFWALLAGCGDKGAEASGKTGAGAPAPDGEAAAKSSDEDGPADRVVVYYFHGTRRCPTCLGIQKIIDQTVEGRFAAEIASGELEFREINYDLDENKHFAKEFELSFSTMIVGAMRGDTVLKWENCDKVWEHSHNHPVLGDYVEERVKAYLAMLKKS